MIPGGGTLQPGPAFTTFNFPAGLFQWEGGTINGGTLINTGSMTVGATGSPTLGGTGTLFNLGTLVVAANNLSLVTGATITNSRPD